MPVNNIKLLLPDGSIWNIEEDGDLDLFLLGIDDSHDTDMSALEALADTRNPLKTPLLEDLEKEFGLQLNSSLTDDERRDRLLGEKTDNNSTATDEWLQDALRKRGFDDIFVHPNNPPVDPRIFLNNVGGIYCDGDTAFCDHEEAVCSGEFEFGELVVNGLPLSDRPEFYEVPDKSGYWGSIFFVGGAAVRDSVTDALLSIDVVEVDASRRKELRKEILKYKPIFSWAGLIAFYT
ncbi:hypothetical protein KAR10_02810 [bacterium]|nr:hypothetical protein [bacterium]